VTGSVEICVQADALRKAFEDCAKSMLVPETDGDVKGSWLLTEYAPCVSIQYSHIQDGHLSGKPGKPGIWNSSGMLLTVTELSGKCLKKSCHGKVSQNCSLLDEY